MVELALGLQMPSAKIAALLRHETYQLHIWTELG